MSKNCKSCGTVLDDTAMFCSNCGSNQSINMQNENTQNSNNAEKGNSTDTAQFTKQKFEQIADTITNKMGESGKVQIRLRDLYTEVFKSHTEDERDKIFACGSKMTTPDEKNILTEWPKPWLYSRIFITLFIVALGLYILMTQFNNSNAIPGFLFMGSLVVPFSVLIFFWEINAPRNISFYQILHMFFIGGVFSLIATLIFYDLPISTNIGTYIGAFGVGFVEELGKVIVTAYFIKKLNSKYILNGILIGGAVGAGFAVFESAGYAFENLLNAGFYQMLNVVILRELLSVGGHVAWAAITGAAIVAIKSDNKFDINILLNARFIFFFILVVVMHGLWDSPLDLGYLKLIILCVAAWVVILIQISSGLKQIKRIVQSSYTQE